MTTKTKELWKTIGVRTAQAFSVFIINGAIFSWLVLNFYGDTNATITIAGIDKVVNVAYWDTLDLKYKALIYGLIVIGLLLTYVVLKFIYKANQQKKTLGVEKEKVDIEKQKLELEKEKQNKLNKIFEKTFGKEK